MGSRGSTGGTRQRGAHPAGQDVSGARGGQRRIAAGVDPGCFSGRVNHRSRSLEHSDHVKLLAEQTRCAEAVLHDRRRAGRQQARCFKRVRGDDGDPVSRAALHHQAAERVIASNGVQRVCIQNQGRASRQDAGEIPGNCLAAATAAYHSGLL